MSENSLLSKDVDDGYENATNEQQEAYEEYPWDAQTVNTNCPVTVNFNYG